MFLKGKEYNYKLIKAFLVKPQFDRKEFFRYTLCSKLHFEICSENVVVIKPQGLRYYNDYFLQ